MNSTKKILGAPYQFLSSVDIRSGSLNKDYGRKFYENILLDAPVISIIPGKPKYLPGESDESRAILTDCLISANAGNSSDFLTAIGAKMGNGDSFRYYGFERDMATYMQYVNTLCRTCADFLGIGDMEYNGSKLCNYSWNEYHWSTNSSSYTNDENSAWNVWKSNVYIDKSTGDNNTSTTTDSNTTNTSSDSSSDDTVATGFVSNFGESVKATFDYTNAISDMLSGSYLEFYIDPDCSSNESISNATGESKIKSIFDSGSEIMKELSFMANSGAGDNNFVEQLEGFADTSLQQLSDALNTGSSDSLVGTLGSSLKRILSLGSNVVKGENVIMPDIYQSSSYDKSYTFTVHLKSPYGCALSYYLDIIVPLMHLLALALPKQTTANTYKSPFLVKAYVDGVFNCDLGMVTSISINKNVNDTVVNTLGCPAEMDVSITITDLYSDLSMSNSDEDPLMFLSNSSLIEYLATTCGISLVRPNGEMKYKNLLHSVQNSITDIGENIKQDVFDYISDTYMKWVGLGG